MKKQLFGLLLLVAGCASPAAEKTLVGHWRLTFNSGSKMEWKLRKDGSHDYYRDNKPFSSGRTLVSNDTLRTYDGICKNVLLGEYYGVYTIDFLSTDSVRLHAVVDSCTPRLEDLDGVVLYRIKP